MDVAGMHAVVVGGGESGLAAAELLLRKGARVTLNDLRTRAELPPRAARVEKDATLALGAHDASVFADADLVVVSPGVPPLEVLDAVEARGVEVIGEVELAARFLTAPVLGITGRTARAPSPRSWATC